MRKHVSKIVATSESLGNLDAIEQFVKKVAEMEVDAVVLLGNLTPKGTTMQGYSDLFKKLAMTQLPTFYIPGPDDCPIEEYLRAAAVSEVAYPHLRGVHATFAMAPGYVAFTGIGGTVVDDLHTAREERETLRYPGWEVEYRLKFLHELKDYQKIFLFNTLPEHKGFHERGSELLAELIKTYNPRVALIGGKEPKHELLGSSLVVVPGSLTEGTFSVIDLHNHTVQVSSIR